MPRLLCSVVTTPERTATRDITLAELARAKLKPLISLNTPTVENAAMAEAEAASLRDRGYEVIVNGQPEKGYGGRNNCSAGNVAFQTALERGTDLLYCEDDLLLAPDFPAFLKLARQTPDAVTYFYIHDGRGDKAAAQKYSHPVWEAIKRARYYHEPFQPAGLYRVRDHRNLNSGQCIHLPLKVLRTLPVDELATSDMAMDMWIQDRVHLAGIPILVALPHPVQHRHDRTGRSPSPNPNKRSESFDLR